MDKVSYRLSCSIEITSEYMNYKALKQLTSPYGEQTEDALRAGTHCEMFLWVIR